jgi:hypothetical protein
MSMKRRFVIAAALASLAACRGGVGAMPRIPPTTATLEERTAVPATPKLVAIDVFGASPASRERLLRDHQEALRRLGQAMIEHDTSVDREAIVAQLMRAGEFALVEPSLVGYFEEDGMAYYLTLDVVETKDAARRMTFAPAPVSEHADPDGLIADWQAFEAKVFELMNEGELSPKRVDCPAFHCFGDPAHAALRAWATTFAERVPHRRDELVAILREDGRDDWRAAAAFLLAYMRDGDELVRAILPAIRDESSFVRNSVMRVLAHIALHHPEIALPLDPVLEALEFPTTTDRNKAAAILSGVVKRPSVAPATRHLVVERAGETLLAMLQLSQPNNHDFAYEILKAVSGESYGERDHAAWKAWLRRNRQ